VYGIRDLDENEYVIKFHRPGRWSAEAVAEEHEFVLECAAADLPVVAPLADSEGFTLQVAETVDQEFLCALYGKRGGRGFDAEGDEEWFRLGALAGRVHQIGAKRDTDHRLVCTPRESTSRFVRQLDERQVVHPECASEFFETCEAGLELIEPLFAGVPLQRIHGDFHRGNILERGEEGLLLIDFDDMMMGPAVQDLWLLLPDHLPAVRRELVHILDGYRQFRPFDESTLRLVEPLRFMRIIYYLAWSAMQRGDQRFQADYPDWGGKAFWTREIEDLKAQLQLIVQLLREE
jgi:Ser/Thr protein kinase RdoA (MazF antagonist)